MIKASSLNFVIIIALIISLISSLMILQLYHYRLEEILLTRRLRLRIDVRSGVDVALALGNSSNNNTCKFVINEGDTVDVKKSIWGLYDFGVVSARCNNDTVSKAFLIAPEADTTKWAALYAVDEGLPIGISGKTELRGDIFISDAGLKSVYFDNIFYTGPSKTVSGMVRRSAKQLSPLLTERLGEIEQMFSVKSGRGVELKKNDSINAHFSDEAVVFDFGKKVQTLRDVRLKGHIIVHSDTTLFIDSTAHLENVIVMAQSITLKQGFSGSCQLFASRSIKIENNCHLNYPSVAALFRFSQDNCSPLEFEVKDKCKVAGILLNFEKFPCQIYPVINIGYPTTINGEIYSSGYLSLDKRGAKINGSVITKRLMNKTSAVLIENYLVNAQLDSHILSKSYLTSCLLPYASHNYKVLQWVQ